MFRRLHKRLYLQATSGTIISQIQAPQTTIDPQRGLSWANDPMRSRFLILYTQESDASEIQTEILGRAYLSTFCFLNSNTLRILAQYMWQ